MNISADEARAIANLEDRKKWQKLICLLESRIKEAAKNGEQTTLVGCDKARLHSKYARKAVEQLEQLGYEVRFSDLNSSCAYIIVRWEDKK
ncbi:MAG: hypothetical protein MJ016_02240 [Victivallaceae bacterium]|nr:hypothetical protein [Victivallaceae bacterium]